jgi:hypothetical protein
MAIQRAVVHGMISGLVQTRNMFTAELGTGGVDSDELLWSTYLTTVYDPLMSIISDQWESQLFEIQEYSSGHWPTVAEVSFVESGEVTGEQIANAVAFVLIGKASGLRHVGRKFFSPLGELTAVGNALVSTQAAHAASALLAYIDPWTGLGGRTFTPGVVDKNGSFHSFVGGFVSSLLGSMRRRKPGVGI